MQENVPLEEVFDHLKCTKDGLSSDEVNERLESFGYNKLEEKKVRKQMLSMMLCTMVIVDPTPFNCFTFLLTYRKANF